MSNELDVVLVTDALMRPFATGPETLDTTKRQQAIEIMKSIPRRNLSSAEFAQHFPGKSPNEVIASVPWRCEMFVDDLYEFWSRIPKSLSSNGRVKFRPGDVFLAVLAVADHSGINTLFDVHLEAGVQEYLQWRAEVHDRLPLAMNHAVTVPGTISLSEIIGDLYQSPDKRISIKIPVNGRDVAIDFVDGTPKAVRSLGSQS